jgi:xanthine/uracil permease
LFPNGTYRENVGLLGSTRIGSRRVIQISSGFMMFFSVLGTAYFSLLLHDVVQSPVLLFY